MNSLKITQVLDCLSDFHVVEKRSIAEKDLWQCKGLAPLQSTILQKCLFLTVVNKISIRERLGSNFQ